MNEWLVAGLVWSRHLVVHSVVSLCIFCVKNDDVKNKMYMDVSVREVRSVSILTFGILGRLGLVPYGEVNISVETMRNVCVRHSMRCAGTHVDLIVVEAVPEVLDEGVLRQRLQENHVADPDHVV